MLSVKVDVQVIGEIPLVTHVTSALCIGPHIVVGNIGRPRCVGRHCLLAFDLASTSVTSSVVDKSRLQSRFSGGRAIDFVGSSS